MKEKRTILRAIRPNEGLRLKYYKQLVSLVDEMATSVDYWLQAEYKANPPAAVAMDAVPSREIQRKVKALSKQWRERFDKAAPKIAEAYLRGSFKATDSAMRAALKKAGLSVKFTMTRQVRDAFNASLAENIGLIRSIPEHYLNQVEGIVARSYATGRDLSTMVKRLKRLYPEAQNRAVLIARDQSNKANAVVERARRIELGITRAIWKHSHAGKTPRPDHVKADGREFDAAKGCLISGSYIFPGEMINCRCVSRSILPGVKIA